ncbi:MAG: TRAP-type transport system periplasmic protein [Clostridia bacterium]|jgi:tripartite ATP-independent transporter DctP family solute receptor|nr:TRAP-type transport system periplasmic protein [Clostridia bacterium]
MRKFKDLTLLIVLLFALSLVVTACGQSTPAAKDKEEKPKAEEPKQEAKEESYEFIVGHTGTEGNSVYIFFDEFKKLVEEKTNGRIKFEMHPAGELGGDKQLVESLQLGTIDIGSAASNNMAGFTDAYLFGDLPYIYKSREGMHKVFNGEIGKKLGDQVLNDVGNKVLTYIDVGGFRLLANTKRPLKTPVDTKGIKLRSTASPLSSALLKAWGASPTPIGWAETYTSVQQGVVDGLHLHPVWLALNGYGEIIKYATEVKAASNVHVVQMNKNVWDKLPQDLQEKLLEAAYEARDIANKADADNEEKFKQDLQKQGVEIYSPTEEEYQQWREKGMSIWPQFENKFDKAFLEQVLDVQ